MQLFRSLGRINHAKEFILKVSGQLLGFTSSIQCYLQMMQCKEELKLIRLSLIDFFFMNYQRKKHVQSLAENHEYTGARFITIFF